MIRVLSIGNSFSQDAQRYLHKVAENENVDMKCVNLYIGGCSLRRHYVNMLDDKADYSFEFNGSTTGIAVSIKQALISDEWDYVTLQQVSHEAPFFDTYLPYLEKLAAYVRLYSPKTKILLHQTWAYEQGSARLQEIGFSDQHDMLREIVASYQKAAEQIQADGIIPCGEKMMQAIEHGIKQVHRDTFHADLGIGRYLLSLTWYHAITGQKPTKDFKEFDVAVSEDDLKIIKDLPF